MQNNWIFFHISSEYRVQHKCFCVTFFWFKPGYQELCYLSICNQKGLFGFFFISAFRFKASQNLELFWWIVVEVLKNVRKSGKAVCCVFQALLQFWRKIPRSVNCSQHCTVKYTFKLTCFTRFSIYYNMQRIVTWSTNKQNSI